MYIPKSFEITDRNKLFDFIQQYNFGIMSSIKMDDLTIFSSHIPFLLDSWPNGEPVLVCHLSKVNQQCSIIENNPKVQVIFTGPHAYISPRYYVTRNVPTWNFTTVHVIGLAHIINSPEKRMEIIKKMVQFHENSERGWKLEKVDQSWVESVMKGFIVIEISNLEIKGKFKLNQDKSVENISSVISHLKENGGLDADCGSFMRKELELKLNIFESSISK